MNLNTNIIILWAYMFQVASRQNTFSDTNSSLNGSQWYQYQCISASPYGEPPHPSLITTAPNDNLQNPPQGVSWKKSSDFFQLSFKLARQFFSGTARQFIRRHTHSWSFFRNSSRLARELFSYQHAHVLPNTPLFQKY